MTECDSLSTGDDLNRAIRARWLPDMVNRYRLTVRRFAARGIAAVLMSLALICSPWPAAAGQDDIAVLMRAIKELQEQNRALTRRLATLEAESAMREQIASPRPVRLLEPPPKPMLAPMPALGRKIEHAEARPRPVENPKRLEKRVKELEDAKSAQEEATRSIIRDSLSTLGSKINKAVSLGGALEVLVGRSSNFKKTTTDTLNLNTAELDLEIQVNEWTLGSITLEYVDGTTDPIFNTNTGFDSNVDRINLDTAFLTIGDTQRFPLYLKAGRMTLPFGTSTGVQRADVLSIESPLTIEVFETKKSAVEIGFAFPTPALGPAPRGVVVPRVMPLVVNPFFSSFGKLFGYDPPPPRPKPPTPVAPTPAAPPLYGSFGLFEGNSDLGSNRNIIHNFNGELGFRIQGHCGRPYSQLRGSAFCPWSVDFNVNYNRSIFESRFLGTEYKNFLSQIGRLSGVAASVTGTFGPVSFVGEWNGVLDNAKFVDSSGKNIDIRPEAWQVAFGYQFDWNPWVEVIGDQGTFVGIGYSESRDLAGVNGTARDGSVPKQRLTLTGGEWVLDGVKLLIEYSHNWDYSKNQGGTGNTANGIFGSLTYVW